MDSALGYRMEMPKGTLIVGLALLVKYNKVLKLWIGQFLVAGLIDSVYKSSWSSDVWI
jgi:hypothetical protein